MRRILYKSICRAMAKTLCFTLIIILVQSMVNQIWGVEEGANALLISGMIIAGQAANTTDFNLPDVFFLLPLTREERKNYVKTEIFAIWVLMGTIFAVMINVAGWKLDEAGIRSDRLEGGGVLLLFILCFSAAYISLYRDYMNRIKSWHRATLVAGLVFKMLLSLILLILLVEGVEIFLTPLGTMFLLVTSLSFIPDLIFTRRFYQNMIAYYADYEVSRGILSQRRSV